MTELWIIWDALRDLVPFVRFKRCEKHPWKSDTFNRVADGSLQVLLYEYLCNYKLETIICWTVQELDVREIAFYRLYTSQPLYLDISLKFLKECNDNHKSIDFNPVTNLCHKYFFKPRHFFSHYYFSLTQPSFSCSGSSMEILEQCGKSVLS